MPDDQQQQQPPVNLADPAALTGAYQKYLEYLQQVGNQKPAQAPQITQEYLDANRPTSLLGQIGEGLSGGPPTDVPMTSAQREAAGTRALFNFSRGLLGTGTFDTIGQALARGETEAERGQYSQEAQIAYSQAAAQDWQRQQMADRLAALKESIPLLQGIQRLNMPSLYGPGGGPGAQAGNAPGTVPGAPGATGNIASVSQTPGWSLLSTQTPEMQAMIQKAAAASGMPVELLAGHKWNESRTASSVPAGDGGASVGIMQMQQGALDTYNKAHNTNYTQQDINKDPQLALNVGAGYWMQLRQQYGSDFLASMAYARGPGATDAWIKNGSKAEDLPDGVRRVLGNVYGPGSFSGASPIPEALQVGGGGKPYQVAGPVVAPPSQQPAQPAAKPPAQGGGTDTAALPVPPIAPPGAVPTVSTPEEAAATAKAAGTYVQVPGTEGLWAKPEGGSTSTPPLIMPGTQTASLTPVVPAPPPGAVTPPAQPPAQPPPTETPKPPETPPPPPAAPARDIMARGQDGSFVIPDDKVSLLEYQQRNRHVPSPEEMQQRGMVLPENPTALQSAYAGVQQAERDANAARQAAQTTYTMGGDPAKAMEAVNNADKQAQDARNAYVNLIQGAGEKNTKALQDYYTEQDRQLAADYKAKVVDPANTARQQQQASDLKIHEGLVAAGTADDQKVLQGIDATTESAHDTLSTLAAAKQLSIAAGNKSALAVLAPGLATMLQRSGLLSQDESNKLDAQQALDGVLSKMAGTMRSSMGFSRMTNMDLQFLQNMVGTSNIPESRRNAMFAFMQTALERQYQYGALVREFYGGGPNAGGMSLAKAREAADDKLGHIVQTVPDGLPPDQGDLFVQQHVSPGTFYVRDGQLKIRGQ